MTDTAARDTPTHLPVLPAEGTRLYTGIGHAPFAPDVAVHLPAGHARDLVASGDAAHANPEPIGAP